MSHGRSVHNSLAHTVKVLSVTTTIVSESWVGLGVRDRVIVSFMVSAVVLTITLSAHDRVSNDIH